MLQAQLVAAVGWTPSSAILHAGGLAQIITFRAMDRRWSLCSHPRARGSRDPPPVGSSSHLAGCNRRTSPQTQDASAIAQIAKLLHNLVCSPKRWAAAWEKRIPAKADKSPASPNK